MKLFRRLLPCPVVPLLLKLLLLTVSIFPKEGDMRDATDPPTLSVCDAELVVLCDYMYAIV